MRLRQLSYLLLLCATAAYTGCPHAGGIIREFGYSEIRPPSTLLWPGTMVSVTSSEPFEARIICAAEASLGHNLRFLQSRTTNGSLRKLNHQKFSLDGATLAGLKSQEHFQSVQDIAIVLDNAQIIELSDDAVLAGLKDRSAACRLAVRQRVRAGHVVTMISSALVGDMKITVSWDRSHGGKNDVSNRALVMKDLAVMFEGEVTSKLSGELHSRGLVWGVRDDAWLSALSIDFVDPSVFEKNTRRISTGKVVTLGDEGRLTIEPAPMQPTAIEYP